MTKTGEPSTAAVSSPASTGGAGTTFEQHVGAYWLAQLLVGAVPPIFVDTTVREVSFQTEHLGWQTDDFLVLCAQTDAPARRIAGQVKRQFTVSASNEDCAKAIGDFWKDFNGPNFSSENDRLVLVTQRGTNTLLEHFAGLLECARASHDGTEFEQRLSTDGFVSDTAIRYCEVLQKIIGNLEGNAVTAADLQPFLRALHVLSLDLFTTTRQAEAQMKTLLAHTLPEGDPLAAATASWHALLSEASAAMAQARTVRRADLPAALLRRHSAIGTAEQKVLRALNEHTKIVLRRIRSTIGNDCHVERTGLIQKVFDALEVVQIVILAGPAGSGKSAIAKDAVTALSPAHFVFGFRVEEFAQPHLNATLLAAQVPANAATISAILAAQGRKVILVESVERLLEKTTRDAFSDLIALARDDEATRIILTCRDYSLDQVRASFLPGSRVNLSVVQVPPLDDAELTQVESAHPPLTVPLKNPALRAILRNPFFLDKALEIRWSPENPVPQSEREFRALFWRDIVRADHGVAGMGRRREHALQTIAVRRARALSEHVPSNDLDPAVVDSLRRDSLITSPTDTPALAATAHDVIEDWAIVQWLDEQHLIDSGSFKTLSTAIGGYPAVRRSYRKWVAELVERDPAASDRLFHGVLTQADISVQFRDDTLVALLKAPSAPALLARHESALVANDRAVLKRVIHLLRVACVTSPPWLDGIRGAQSILNIPDGPAWHAILRLVHGSLAAFTAKERMLLLALVEDAVRGVSWSAPDIDGAEFVAAIAHSLLDGTRGYSAEEQRKRLLEVIAKIPTADPDRFAKTLRGHIAEDKGRDRVADDFRGLIFAGTHGLPGARDLPDLIISVGADYLLASEEEISASRHSGRTSLDIDIDFGMRELGYDFFPASGFRGPWGYLLRHHTAKAIDFYIRVFNHSAEWYAQPQLRRRLEPPSEVALAFADGSVRKHWLNGRFWGLYRGMTVGPYSLRSLLMALERWLLQIGEEYPERLDALLLDLLRRSDSAALAAVVASAATAYPHAAGETLLVLLSVRDYVVIDRTRMAAERQAAGLSALVPTQRVDQQMYEMERKEADAAPHRRHDLEWAITQLQLGPLAGRVQALLDLHLAALPPKDEQDDADLTWRLAIHRMDLREYTVAEIPDLAVSESGGTDADPKRLVRLDPKPLDADVQTVVDDAAKRQAEMVARLGVFVWALKAFNRDSANCDTTLWASKLVQAQAMDREADHRDGSRSAPGFVAAVCIRDHWNEMSPEHQEWCVEVVCSEVLRNSGDADSVETRLRNPMSADRAAASVLASLLRKPLSDAQMQRVRDAFITCLTHPVDEVRWNATRSIGGAVWAEDRALALRCVNAVAAEAAILDQAHDSEEGLSFKQRRQTPDIVAATAADIRARFWRDGAIAEDAHATVDIASGFGANAMPRMLAMLGTIPQDSLAIATFARAARTLVDWWTADDDHHGSSSRNYQVESEVSDSVQEFLLRTTPDAAREVLAPILAVVDHHSRELQTFMQGLTRIQDRDPNTAQYWFLWERFADAVKDAKWIARLDATRAAGSELLYAVFLTSGWRDNIRHWGFLDDHAHLVHALFEALPPGSIVLDCYTRFLYHIGERSLPDAFVRIAEALRRRDAQQMLEGSNTVFMLEAILGRYVYGRPLALKRDDRIRDAVLFILDCLVESGSSAAFRMRDDFVTPAA